MGEQELLLLRAIEEEFARLKAENERLRRWIDDLQAGQYTTCVYCGHQYGPTNEVPSSKAEVLKQHIEACPDHPMSKLRGTHQKLRTHCQKVIVDLATCRCDYAVAPSRAKLACQMREVETELENALACDKQELG